MLIPFYNFLALRLDHNVVLIPLWAIATYAFARAFLTRSVTWSVATGIAAGAAVLAKYWSFFLLFGLIVAALADRRRLQFLKSPAPWIMTAVSFGIFLPHLIWLDANGYPTLVYAKHRLAETWPDLEDALTNYTFGTIAYVAAPLVLLAILVKPTRQALRDTLFPSDDDRRFAAMISGRRSLSPSLLRFSLRPASTRCGRCPNCRCSASSCCRRRWCNFRAPRRRSSPWWRC